MFNFKKELIISIVCFLLLNFTFAQGNSYKVDTTTTNHIKTSIHSGSAKELSKIFHSTIELNFNGDKSSYSRTQAEYVLRDFFKTYPPLEFQIVHSGSSSGLNYLIGQYQYSNGVFKVLFYIKKVGNSFLINNISFSEK